MHWTLWALILVLARAGSKRVAKMAMMPITTSSSTRVNACSAQRPFRSFLFAISVSDVFMSDIKLICDACSRLIGNHPVKPAGGRIGVSRRRLASYHRHAAVQRKPGGIGQTIL